MSTEPREQPDVSPCRCMNLLNHLPVTRARMHGKTVVITGCNTGIGKETARDMVRRGARVVMANRSVEKSQEAANDIRQSFAGADIVVYK